MELHKRGPETDGEPANGEMKPEEEEGEEQVLLSASTFEDLLELVGTRGRWNVLLFFTATYAYFVSPMLIMSYQFLGATPEHWCLVEPLIEANWTQDQVLSFAIPLSSSGGYDSCHMYDYNYTAAAAMGYEAAMDDLKGSTNHTILCRTRDFNHTQYQSTVVTEWDLVCERRPLYSTTQSILSAGSILGLLVGFLFDKYGRRAVILRIIVLYLFLANIIIFSPNVVVYIIIRAIISCLDISLYVGTFVVVMETCATRYRSAVGALTVVPWAVGNMFTATVAYFIRDWKLLTICLALPLLLIVSYFWLLPESPLWLLHVGRYERALVELKKAAKMNGKTLPPDHQLLRTMRSVDRREEEATVEEGVMTHLKKGLEDMAAPFVRPELRMRTIMYVVWFISSFVYYGISLISVNLGISPHLYIFIAGFLEIPSGLLMWPCIEHLGRRKTQVTLYLLCGMCGLAMAVAVHTASEGRYWIVLGLSLCGKMAITAVYQLAWIYTTELFPTKYRSIALSQGQFMENLASMTSPYINDLLGEVMQWAPSAVFGSAALVAALIAIILPETKGTNFSDLDTLVRKNDTSQQTKDEEERETLA